MLIFNQRICSILFVNCLFLLIQNITAKVSKKDPCTDYPSCQLISEKMFESYCSRSTLKNMCPTHCDKKCKKSSVMTNSPLDTTMVGSDETDVTETTSEVESSKITSDQDEQYTSDEAGQTKTTLSTTTTTSTTKKVKGKHRKPIVNRKQTVKTPPVTSTRAKPSTTTTVATTTIPVATSDATTTTTTVEPSTTVQTSQLLTREQEELKKLHANQTVIFKQKITTTTKPLHTELPDKASETTKTVSNLPNATIYVPLFEAGFVQRIIPTSSKDEYDFSKAKLCKKVEECEEKSVWCPLTNDVPKEQIEVLLNYTTDIYMLETQGSVFKNETVTSFLFQYLNDAGILVSRLFRAESNNSTQINKYMFDPPFRTNYMRITPIDFYKAIAFRFEIYSKGVLYNPSKK